MEEGGWGDEADEECEEEFHEIRETGQVSCSHLLNYEET